MDRITGNTTDLGGGRRGFRGRDLALGQAGTVPGAGWFNDVQEEILGPIEALGLAATAGNRAQLLQALRRIAGGNALVVTASLTLTADDAGVVAVSAASGPVTITLPEAGSAGGAPLRFTFFRTDTSANAVTVQRAGSNTIEGGAALGLLIGQPVLLVSDGGSSWRVVARPGLNRAYAEYTANADLTTPIPVDDTIPQITEGTQILGVTITPRTATSRIRVEFRCHGGTNSVGASGMTAALFLNGGVNAVRAAVITVPGNGNMTELGLIHEFTPGTTAPQILTLRVGPQNGSMRLNGVASARFLGGTKAAILTATEVS